MPFWEGLVQVQLQDNPWRCDCRLQWMADSLLPQLQEKDEEDARKIA